MAMNYLPVDGHAQARPGSRTQGRPAFLAFLGTLPGAAGFLSGHNLFAFLARDEREEAGMLL